jgi:hypothetical protein
VASGRRRRPPHANRFKIFANQALSKRFAGRDVSDRAKIEVLLLWLTLIRKVAQSALPPEYIIDQPDISPAQADAIAEEAEAIRARAAEMAAQRDRRKDN